MAIYAPEEEGTRWSSSGAEDGRWKVDDQGPGHAAGRTGPRPATSRRTGPGSDVAPLLAVPVPRPDVAPLLAVPVPRPDVAPLLAVPVPRPDVAPPLAVPTRC
ncbi:MAG: hypothetical protein R3E12_17365 [Candidatus Eisenbacteria bacterium]